MNARRGFLRLASIGAAFGVAPLAASVAAVTISPHSTPMRGTNANGSTWEMIRLTSVGPDMPDSQFITSHMEQRADGHYVLVFDRES